MPDQAGRTILVTGANSGLGHLTSLALAQHGAHVIMTSRCPEKGAAALMAIRAARPRGTAELRRLDLADLDEVRRFADRLLTEGRPIDVLVNNAGVMMPPRSLTKQGHELQFGVNHLAHFLLTCRLMTLLQQRGEGRVVTLSSDLHRARRDSFRRPRQRTQLGRIAAYAQSKLANVLFATELHRRAQAAGAPLRSLLAHPGYAATNLQLSGPTGLLKLFMRIGNRWLAQPAEMGVLPQLYAATAPVASGSFIGPDGPNEKRGYPALVQPAPAGRDAASAARLWAISEELTGTSLRL